MTNTLHRYGTAESFVDDYIVFSLPAKSKQAGQQGDALAAQKRFMQLAAEYKPISLGDALKAGVEDTFNAVTIDGDTSTSDTLLAFAGGTLRWFER